MRLLKKIGLVAAILMSQAAAAQSPYTLLSKLPQDMREWVDRSCSRSLGPSLWSSCITREATAASRGKPDLSRFKGELQTWVIRSCPDTLGPSLTISCLARESAALDSAHQDYSSLGRQEKEWLADSCPSSLGPSLFLACVQREATALRRMQALPSPLSATTSDTPRPSYGIASYASNRERYEIETAQNDALFVINGEVFDAQTYCLGWKEGDEILFLDGSPHGACVEATLLNLRTREKCDVWCG